MSQKAFIRMISFLLLLFSITSYSVYSGVWVFLKRVVTYPRSHDVTAVDWYTPKEVIQGSFTTDFSPLDQNQVPFRPESISETIDYAEALNSSALLIAYQGQLIVEKYWHGFHSSSLSNSMSMAKTIAALLVGSLIQEKKIHSEEDLVSLYLPDLTDEKKQLSIKNILMMESGLKFNESLTSLRSDLISIHFGNDINPILTHLKFASEPGSGFKYQNVNAQIIGKLIQTVSHQRYAQYLSEKLWQPIGARDGYVWLDRENGMAKTYCCIFATPRDWLRVGLLLLNEGKFATRSVIDQNWIKKMKEPSEFEPEYGYFTWLGNSNGKLKKGKNERSQPYLAPDLFFLDGSGKQRVYIMPSQELVIVRVESVLKFIQKLKQREFGMMLLFQTY